MTRPIRFLVALSVAVLTLRSAKAEDLFSEVAISSVFTEERIEVDSVAKSVRGRRLGGVVSLKRMLSEAGFRTQDLGNDGVLLVLQAPGTKDGMLNVAIGVNPTLERIIISAPLVKIIKAKSTLDDLLLLMNRGRSNSGIYFAVADQIVSIRRTLENDGVSKSLLKSQIDELVEYAKSHAAAWEALGKTMTQLETEKRKTALVKEQDVSLVGRWSAEGSGGVSYGFVFSTSRYQLAIVANGQVHRSDGTWTLKDSQLVLVSAGTDLSGSVMRRSKDQLILKFKGQDPLTFTKQ